MRRMTGYMDKKFPFNYLGCPIYSGKKNLSYFDSMRAKIFNRLNGWQSSKLSDGGKITLIKHVLQSIPIYTLSALNPPKGTICLIEMHFANFFGELVMVEISIIGVSCKIYVSRKMKGALE